MTPRQLIVATSTALLAACIGGGLPPPAPATAGLTSADVSPETSVQNPALVQLDPALEAERERWLAIERVQRERDFARMAVRPRVETARLALAGMKTRLARTPPADRRELELRIEQAEAARTNLEHKLHDAQVTPGWPALRTALEAALEAFETAVREETEGS